MLFWVKKREMTGIENRVYGYIRVSTREQNEDRQYAALRGAGVPQGQIYAEKCSGKNFDRPQYKNCFETEKTTCFISKASIVWGAITAKFWNNGGCSRKKKAWTLWFWTCRFWIRGAAKT